MYHRRANVMILVLIMIAAALSSCGLGANISNSSVAAGQGVAKASNGSATVSNLADDFFETSAPASSKNLSVNFKKLGNKTAKATSAPTAAGKNASQAEKKAVAPLSKSTSTAAGVTGLQGGDAANKTSNKTSSNVTASVKKTNASAVSGVQSANLTDKNLTAKNVMSKNQTLGNKTLNATNATAQGNKTGINATGKNLTANATAGANETLKGNATLNATDNTSLSLQPPANKTKNLTAGSNEQVGLDNGTPVQEGESKSKSTSAQQVIDFSQYPTDRIWHEGSPLVYTWTPISFAGFFYDIDEDVGTEMLTIDLPGSNTRAIDEGRLLYTSYVQNLAFQYGEWGHFQVLGFMADKYFAGYRGTKVLSKDVSLINNNQLRKVLIDNDDERTITTGSVLPLGENYELRIKEIDLNGNKVFLALAKSGEEVDSKVISPSYDDLKGSTYMYKVKISGEDVPIVMAHVSNVFAGAESSAVTVDGLFQISDNFASVQEGDMYDRMKVQSVSDLGITMKNKDSFTLSRDKTVNIMGGVGFQVADNESLRFAPVVERKGSYSIRGTIVDPSKVKSFTWTPFNFEGFYYDINDNISTESMTVTFTGDRIEEKELKYQTAPMPVKFEYGDWGKYQVIGFMADKYFAGYNNQSKFTDEFSMINEGELRKVIMDRNDEMTLNSGSVLPLGEGYELSIKEVDLEGNKVFMAVSKGGSEVGSKVLYPSASDPKSKTFTYKVKIASEDVPIIAVNVENVFKGSEANVATIKGIFQVSDTPQKVETGEMHGKMKVKSLSDQGITMENDGSIGLGRGKEVEVMGDLKFKVADNTTRRMSPVAYRVGQLQSMVLKAPETIVNKTVSIEVTSAGKGIGGARVLVSGQDIGTTDSSGVIKFRPEKAGTLAVSAKLSGYTDVNGSITVRTDAEARKMLLDVPSEVMKNETFQITVRGGLNASALQGATVTYDGQYLGTTDVKGSLSYKAMATGSHAITASKSEFDTVRKNITVKSPIVIQSINTSAGSKAGSEMDVIVEIKNVGKGADNRSFSLLVNGNKTASKDVFLEPGETKKTIIKYRPEKEGLYTFEAEGQQKQTAVAEGDNYLMLIGVLVLILLLIGGGLYLHKSGELNKLREQIKKK